MGGSAQIGQGQIFLNGHVGSSAFERVLEQAANRLGAAEIRLEGHIHPIQQNAAGIRNKAACNGIEQGGFARAVGTHNGSELAAFHMQIDIGQRFFLVHRTGVKGHTDMVQIKHGSCPLSG